MTISKRQRRVGYKLLGSEAFRKSGVKFATYAGDSGDLLETLESESHQVSQLGKTRNDIGGPFHHWVTKFSDIPQVVNVTDSNGNVLRGHAAALSVTEVAAELSVQNASAGEGKTPTKGDLNAAGTTAIARCNPDNPNAALAQFLGELHEGIPRGTIETMQSRTRKFRALGSDYLNVEFGWEPFVSDIKNLCHSVVHSHDVISQYHRDAGKPIRRSYRYEPQVTTTEIVDVGAKAPFPLSSSLFHGSGGKRTRTRTVTTNKWFSGAFTYPLFLDGTLMGKLHQHYADAQHLLGIGLTPDVVWELTPWSWLIDWYSNVGDVMTNVRAFMFDGLVMLYGYIMWEIHAVTDVYLVIPKYWSDGSDHTSVAKIETVNQNRLPATPFGFGVDLASLSARQIAILGALGLVLVL